MDNPAEEAERRVLATQTDNVRVMSPAVPVTS